MIPETKIIPVITNGKMKLYDLKKKEITRTALDDTFYTIFDKVGKKSTPLFDFDDIVQTELIASNVELDENDKKYVKLIFLILFKTKLVLFQQKYYPEPEKIQRKTESSSSWHTQLLN